MEEEKVFTIPLKNARKTGKKERAAKATKLVKKFIKKHMDVNEVKISAGLNKKIWSRGAEKPPVRVKVRASKLADDVAEASSIE